MTKLLLILLWMTGIDSVDAEYFRTWYHRSELVHYLEAVDPHTIVETHTTGQWTEPERLVFSIEGIDYTHNRFYIDGMRVDDRFLPGSTLYRPDMQAYNLTIDTHSGALSFDVDTAAKDYVQASYNFGQISNGEPAAGTAALIHLFHRTPMESADTWQHVTERRHYRGAGTAESAFTLWDKQGNDYRQHVYAAYGQRDITRQNERGFMADDPLYTTYYYRVQADGYLPMRPNRAFDKLGYRLNFSGRGDGGSEFFYNHDEVYDHKNYSGTIYGKRIDRATGELTTGLTWATNVVHHANRSFSRNIVDQDGESFEPWIPDGKTHELSWAVNYQLPLLSWLRFDVDAYNSLLYFNPEATSWTNERYVQGPLDETPTALKSYHWTSRAHASGLLENTLRLCADYSPHPTLDIHGKLALTLDGMLLGGGQTKISPNAEASFSLEWRPVQWFELGFALGHYRMRYTADYLRFLDPEYMNRGTQHVLQKGLGQTAYAELDIPFRFHFTDSRKVYHEFAFLQSYKKFYNVWRVNDVQDDVYTIGVTPTFGTNPLLNTPHYFSQLSRYTLVGPHVTFSIGWQSMQAASYAALGNGANANSLGILSETTALPSTTDVVRNSNAPHPGVGRLDNDKGFVLRMYFGYNICRWVQMGFTAKWTDGKPFSAYYYSVSDDEAIIRPVSSRGTNPTDGNFGTRHSANWQIDLHLQGSWWAAGHKMTANLECYNVWDFCCDQAEMAFVQDIPQASRASMIMNVPTGLLLRLRCDL